MWMDLARAPTPTCAAPAPAPGPQWTTNGVALRRLGRRCIRRRDRHQQRRQRDRGNGDAHQPLRDGRVTRSLWASTGAGAVDEANGVADAARRLQPERRSRRRHGGGATMLVWIEKRCGRYDIRARRRSTPRARPRGLGTRCCAAADARRRRRSWLRATQRRRRRRNAWTDLALRRGYQPIFLRAAPGRRGRGAPGPRTASWCRPRPGMREAPVIVGDGAGGASDRVARRLTRAAASAGNTRACTHRRLGVAPVDGGRRRRIAPRAARPVLSRDGHASTDGGVMMLVRRQDPRDGLGYRRHWARASCRAGRQRCFWVLAGCSPIVDAARDRRAPPLRERGSGKNGAGLN